jgi:hypothetical protein
MDNISKKQNNNDNAKMDKEKLTEVLSNILSEKISLKENIPTSDMLELKRALNPVNNFITKELTDEFIKNLEKIFANTPDALPDELKNTDELLNDNAAVNVNANGYDFFKAPIIAEVKANIPYEKNKYGASQKSGLTKDINGLLDAKNKKGGDGVSLEDYYKFLVILDYERNDYKSSDAVEDLKKCYEKKHNLNDTLVILNISKPVKLDKDHIYIVKLKL